MTDTQIVATNAAPKKSGRLNRFQAAVAKSYGGGDYAYLIDSPTANSEYEDAGDTLFTFLMRELSDTEDCENLETAIGRMENAVRDVMLARDEILALPDLPEPDDADATSTASEGPAA